MSLVYNLGSPCLYCVVGVCPELNPYPFFLLLRLSVRLFVCVVVRVRGPIQSLTDKSPGVEANRLAAAAELLAEPTFLAELKKLTAAETISNATRPA